MLIGHDNGWPVVGWRLGDVRATRALRRLATSSCKPRDARLSMNIFDVFIPASNVAAGMVNTRLFRRRPLGTLDIVKTIFLLKPTRRYCFLVALGYHRMNERLRA